MGCFGSPFTTEHDGLNITPESRHNVGIAPNPLGCAPRPSKRMERSRPVISEPRPLAVQRAYERRAKLVPCPHCGKSYSKPRAQALHNFWRPKKPAAASGVLKQRVEKAQQEIRPTKGGRS
jgi:hypothetical protein